MTNHNTNEGSKFQAIKGGIEMTNSMLHNRINASVKILGGLALGVMLVTTLALPMTASADPAVLPLTKAIHFETSDVGPYTGHSLGVPGRRPLRNRSAQSKRSQPVRDCQRWPL